MRACADGWSRSSSFREWDVVDQPRRADAGGDERGWGRRSPRPRRSRARGRQLRERRAPRLDRVFLARAKARAHAPALRRRDVHSETRSASPSWSRAVSTTRISTGTLRSRTSCFTTATCCASFRPNHAICGRTRLNSLRHTVATPRKWPGRCSPSSPSAAPAGSTHVAKPVGVHLLGRRREDDVDSVRGGERGVAVEVARVRAEVCRVRELRRVHEDARDQHVALGRAAANSAAWPSCSAPIVGTRPTIPCRGRSSSRDRARDDHGRVASASAS